MEEDRVETLIRGNFSRKIVWKGTVILYKLLRSTLESGCWDDHLRVVECMSKDNDWRKCQQEVGGFLPILGWI
jgi:hypothetical protein